MALLKRIFDIKSDISWLGITKLIVINFLMIMRLISWFYRKSYGRMIQ